MSEIGKAVFLSYASQDAEAAKRICESLRAAGVEVWFDQSELRGGDSWDQKIRRQIKECALFVPVVSAATQARREGYFRLEWKLADDRTHLMAKGTPFLLPVCIDDTKDWDAIVPDSFMTVQWTRLPGGETSARFCERVAHLLAGESAVRPVGVAASRPTSRPARASFNRLWLFLLIPGAILFLATGGMLIKRFKESPGAAAVKAAASPVTEAQKLTRQARALLDDDPLDPRENYFLADELAQRAVKADPTDGEAWATAGRVSALMVRRKFDASAARRDQARMQVERAMSLAPGSVESALALALQQDVAGRIDEAVRMLDELAKRAPGDWRIFFELAQIAYRVKRFDEAINRCRQAQAVPGADGRVGALEFAALQKLMRWAEARVKSDQLIAEKPARLVYFRRLVTLGLYVHDVPAARAFIEKIPPRVMQEDAVISTLAEFYLRTGEGDRALAELKRMPREFFEDGWDWRPKGYLAGYAHQISGRATAAQAEWKQALAVVEKRLVAEPNQSLLLYWKSLLQALTGQIAEARAGRKLQRELDSSGETWFDAILQVALGDREAAIADLVNAWPKIDVPMRNNLWGDLLYAPWFAAIRADPRIQAMATAHKAAIDRALKPGGAATAAADLAAKSVAVLAFKNLSGDPAREFFSDGLSEAVTDVLGRVPGLKVVGSASAFSFKGKAVPIPEIARQLGVTHLVEGTVLQEGQTVRITAKLIKADGFQVWVSDKLDRELKNIFALHDEVAGLIATNLSLKLGVDTAQAARAVNPEAYQLHLQGRQAWNRRSEEGYVKAEALFSRAIELDPLFARAYVGRADARVFLATRRGQAGRWSLRDSPQLAPVEADVRRALELEPDLAEGHTSLANLHRNRGDHEAAHREFLRAIELNPNYATAHQWLGIQDWRRGLLPEARESILRAVEADPLSSVIAAACSVVLQDFGEAAAALVHAERAVVLQPDSSRALGAKAMALLLCGQQEAAVAVARTITEPSTQGVGRALLVLGSAGLAEEVERKRHVSGPLSDLVRLQGAAALGKWDEFFAAWGPQVLTLDDPWFLYVPALDPVRDDPRFLAVLKEAGLVEAHVRVQAWRKAHPPEKPEGKK